MSSAPVFANTHAVDPMVRLAASLFNLCKFTPVTSCRCRGAEGVCAWGQGWGIQSGNVSTARKGSCRARGKMRGGGVGGPRGRRGTRMCSLVTSAPLCTLVTLVHIPPTHTPPCQAPPSIELHGRQCLGALKPSTVRASHSPPSRRRATSPCVRVCTLPCWMLPDRLCGLSGPGGGRGSVGGRYSTPVWVSGPHTFLGAWQRRRAPHRWRGERQWPGPHAHCQLEEHPPGCAWARDMHCTCTVF